MTGESLSPTRMIAKLPKLSHTPGNFGRNNQNDANGILTGASGYDLQTVDRMSTNLLGLKKYICVSADLTDPVFLR